MAEIRLFASIREAAGTSRATFDAKTVEDAVNQAVAKFGPEFAEHLKTCKIWVNGEPAEDSTIVGPDDEIALLPPVSGG